MMQTFLPYPSFVQSVKALDNKRLGKQRVEAWQILSMIRGDIVYGKAWRNHPAVLMWQGYEEALRLYGFAACTEWKKRSFKDTLLARFPITTELTFNLPPWLNDERVHSSHGANLLRKDPSWYGKFNWSEKPAEGYYWPVTKDSVQKSPNGHLSVA